MEWRSFYGGVCVILCCVRVRWLGNGVDDDGITDGMKL